MHLVLNMPSQMNIGINIDRQLQTRESGMEETGPNLDYG